MAVPAGLRALQHRDFRLFWSGQMVSLIGSWMQTVGQSWLILELTNSPFKLGLISTLQFGPMLLFSLAAGAITDRLPKRRTILITQTCFMLLAFTLAALVWTERVQYWHVAVLAALLGTVNTLDLPARQSFIVEMVGREHLSNAIALNSAVFNVARILGPVAAGLLVARYGVALAFTLNGITFIAVIFALTQVRAEGLPRPRSGRSMLQEIGEGLRYALKTPLVALLLATLSMVSLFAINYNVLVPLLARQVLGLEAEGFGALMSSLGFGALSGALVMASQTRSMPPLRQTLALGLTLCAACLSMAFVGQFWLASALLFVMGFSQIIFTTSINTTLQLLAPDELRGRVMSLYTLVFAGVAPIGSFLMGSVTEVHRAPAGFFVGGSMGLVTTLAILAWWRLKRPGQAEATESGAPR